MEKGRIEFDDPTFQVAKSEMLHKTKPFDISTAFEAGWQAAESRKAETPELSNVQRAFVCRHAHAACPECAEEHELRVQQPIDMIIYCPNCGVQHVDKPEPLTCECGCSKYAHEPVTGMHVPDDLAATRSCSVCRECDGFVAAWDNPPHKSHLCKPEDGGCGSLFRIADVPTNGVAEIKTRGENDTWPERS